jgi:hypothetical protein
MAGRSARGGASSSSLLPAAWRGVGVAAPPGGGGEIA